MIFFDLRSSRSAIKVCGNRTQYTRVDLLTPFGLTKLGNKALMRRIKSTVTSYEEFYVLEGNSHLQRMSFFKNIHLVIYIDCTYVVV